MICGTNRVTACGGFLAGLGRFAKRIPIGGFGLRNELFIGNLVGSLTI